MNGGNNMKIRKVKKKLKKKNDFVKIMWLKHVKEWCNLSHKLYNIYPTITEHYIKFCNNKIK